MKFMIDRLSRTNAYNRVGMSVPLALLPEAKIGQLYTINIVQDVWKRGDERKLVQDVTERRDEPKSILPYTNFLDNFAKPADAQGEPKGVAESERTVRHPSKEEAIRMLNDVGKMARHPLDQREPQDVPTMDELEDFSKLASGVPLSVVERARHKAWWLASGSSCLNADDPKVSITIETWGSGWAFNINRKRLGDGLLEAGKCDSFGVVMDVVVNYLIKLWQEAENER